MCSPWKMTFTLAPLAPLTMNSPYKQKLCHGRKFPIILMILGCAP
jgi:hypothetical protein